MIITKKKLKQLITLLLLSTAFVACKKEETLKDGELKVIVQPYLPDNQVVPGIRVIIYDADAQVMIQDKNLYAKKENSLLTTYQKRISRYL